MNNNQLGQRCAAAIFALVLASCASAPTVSEGEEDLPIGAAQRVRDADPDATVAVSVIEGIDGARCAMSNDKGTWSAITPATVRVRRSSQPLEYECAKEGYRPASGKLECLTPRQRLQKAQQAGAAGIVALAPLALLSPVAVGGQLLVASAGVAASAAAPPPENADVCTYLGLLARMQPEKAVVSPSTLDSPTTPAPLEANDGRAAVALDAVLVRNGPGAWARNAEWDEYLFRARNLSPDAITIRGATLLDEFAQPVQSQPDRRHLVEATVHAEHRRGIFGGESGRMSGSEIAVAGAGGAALGVGYIAAATVPSSLAGASAAAVAPAAGVIALAAIAAGAAKHQGESSVDAVIAKRRTVLPIQLAAGESAALDVFFPVTPKPSRLVMSYADASGDHAVSVDTRLALAQIHVEPPPKLLHRVEPDISWSGVPHDVGTGKVIARVQVDPRGTVLRVDITEAEPAGVFEKDVFHALFQWRYAPKQFYHTANRIDVVRLDFVR